MQHVQWLENSSNCRVWVTGCEFYALETETPGPVLNLESGTAYFSNAAFSALKGTASCGAMRVHAGAVAVQGSSWYDTGPGSEHDICIADTTSRVYADSPMRVTSLEEGVEVGSGELDAAEEQPTSFLSSADDELLQLIKVPAPYVCSSTCDNLLTISTIAAEAATVSCARCLDVCFSNSCSCSGCVNHTVD